MRFHNFTSSSLARVIRAGDSHRFDVDLVKDRDAILANAVSNANDTTIDFRPSHIATVNNRACVSLKNYGACLALRSISIHLSRKFHLRLMNRDEIVLGVIRALNDTAPMYIVRRDIKSFYETIPTRQLKDRLALDTSISKAARQLLKQFFEVYCAGDMGIPRGLSLSATLAELSLAEFDRTIQRLPGVYRYFRFSDDILLFCYKQPNETMLRMEEALPVGMQFNSIKSGIIPITKTDKSDAKEVELEYLGYKFAVSELARATSPKTLELLFQNARSQS